MAYFIYFLFSAYVVFSLYVVAEIMHRGTRELYSELNQKEERKKHSVGCVESCGL